MWKLKRLIVILAAIAAYSCHGAGTPGSQAAGITPATQIKKSFDCSICGNPFSLKSNLARHMLTHTGERPHPCSKCGKNFAEKGTLTIHMRTHTGERPYHCAECGKDFAQKSNLIKHMQTHTGEQPYSCSKCGRSFALKGYLGKHLRTCKHMQEEFEDPDILEERLKSKHLKIGTVPSIGPDFFGETGAAASPTKASAAREDLE